MEGAQRKRRWLSMLTNVMPNGTSEVEFEFVMDLVRCQPRVADCVWTSSVFGGRGYHAPCELQLLKGSVLGVYGGGLPCDHFTFEYPMSKELLYGKPRNRSSPAIVCANAAYGLSQKRFAEAEMEACWYYVTSARYTTAEMKAKLDGFALELKDGRLVVMLYVSRRACTVKEDSEMFVQSYGRTFWPKQFNEAAMFEVRNMPEGSKFVSSEFVNIDGHQFVGLFWAEVTDKQLFYPYDQSTTSLLDDSVFLGNAPVVSSKGAVIRRVDKHHRVLFSKAIQHYFAGENMMHAAYVSTGFTKVMDSTGKVIGDFDSHRMGECVEAFSVASSMINIVWNNFAAEIEPLLPEEASFVHQHSVEAIVAEDDDLPPRVSITDLRDEYAEEFGLDTPHVRKRLGYSSSFVAFEPEPDTSACVGTQTEVPARKRMRSTSPVVVFETQPVQRVSVATQTLTPWAKPRTLSDFMAVLEEHRDSSDTRAIVLMCRDVLTASMKKETPVSDLHRVYELVIQHHDQLFVKPCVSLAGADTVAMLFHLAVRINIPYEQLTAMVSILPWVIVHPEAFHILSDRADTSSEAVILYVQCATILLRRGLDKSVLKGLTVFRNQLGAQYPIPVAPSGPDALNRVDKLLQSAALFSPEMHDAVLQWRLMLLP